jgi:hypothetical protein
MPETKTYTGGCHCGAVRFEAKIALGDVISCNCSICQMRGSLLTAIPPADFRLLAGEDALTKYQFNTRAIHHLFCSTCGIESFSRGTAPDGKVMVAINARCLDGVELANLAIKNFNGRAL